MNLGLKAMVTAHGPRVLAACEKARDAFCNMDDKRRFRSLQEIDETTRLAVNDDIVIIPIANEYKGGIHHGIDAKDIGQMLMNYVNDIKEDIKHNQLTKKQGRSEVWVAQNVWAIEKSMRGETDLVSIGISPVGLRLLALLEVHVQTKEPESQLVHQINWEKCYEHFRGKEELERILAQKYIQTIVNKTAELRSQHPDKNLDWIESMTVSYEIENVRPGQIEMINAEILPGEVFAVVAISQSIDRKGHSKNIYIDGASILVCDNLPHTAILNLNSKRLQNLFDHTLIADLDIHLTSEEFVQSDDTTMLFFSDNELIPLQIKNTPESWTDSRNF